MIIQDFCDDKYRDKQYDYKILLYGNYTYRDNLEADSLVEVLRHVIPFMSKRWKIHFSGYRQTEPGLQFEGQETSCCSAVHLPQQLNHNNYPT